MSKPKSASPKQLAKLMLALSATADASDQYINQVCADLPPLSYRRSATEELPPLHQNAYDLEESVFETQALVESLFVALDSKAFNQAIRKITEKTLELLEKRLQRIERKLSSIGA